MKKRTVLLLLVLSFPSLGISSQPVSGPGAVPVKVELHKTGNGYQLLRDGQPYFIKGAAEAHSLAALQLTVAIPFAPGAQMAHSRYWTPPGNTD
jgi:hypothetical protein